MYHAIVRAQLRRAFASINRGDYDAVIAAFHPGLCHVFYGHHALAGIRREMPQTKLWYGRLASHYTIKVPWAKGLERAPHKSVTVSVGFTDYLTGRYFGYQQAVEVKGAAE